ncbi:kinase-like protein [Neolentinus lepideus HHB14362 ss-1]|uniref:non-specific serine/threonine protein kinase n=1 Tax=Neolentinus lepideus HHB14362 ss-1 TaxID=1314782 RepID=A0A165N4T4_9AGAM|nr:kinase-like protein [Neolentinus lepideus HHB14362 ss-1]
MTNVPSGSKRPRDGSDDHTSYKRTRDEPKDWRDVHLRSRTDSRRESIDRRDSRDYGRARDHVHRRGSDYDRGKDRRYSREHNDDRRRDKSRQREDSRARMDVPRDRRRSTPPRSHPRHLRPPEPDSEKEEGEISPRPSRATSPPLTPSTRAPTEDLLNNKKYEDQDTEYDLSNSPPAIEETLAARRARRQAILAKYASKGLATGSQGVSPSPGPSSAVQPPPNIPSVSDPSSQPHSASRATPSTPVNGFFTTVNGSNEKRDSASASPTPTFDLTKNDEQEDIQMTAAEAQNGTGEQISAADYDPSLDRREDEEKRVRGAPEGDGDVEMIEEEEEEDDDDLDDMFAVATHDKKKKVVKKVKRVSKPVAPALITTLDSAADAEGYYQIILGEQLDGGHYQVFSSLGKGMFANVVRARVLTPEPGDAGKEVAIKIVRCQETMYKAGLKEVQILGKLRQADPEDKKHIVRLERTFEHRGHLCLVFESLSINLRDVVKRFGKDIGLNIKAVRAYAHQLFLALGLLRKCNVMHADIKPDNILVNEQKTLLKLCDLGSASDASENEITPYLVSRFYRAPEIILGAPYDPAIDVWSIGCTLYELYTGKILFPGRSNNQMLLLMMELKGRFNSKMIKKAKFGDMYFDDLGGFQSVEKDRVTGAGVIRKVHVAKPSRDLRARLMPSTSAAKLKDDENRLLTSFVDLLDRCLMLDPARRITPKEALVHPFIRG